LNENHYRYDLDLHCQSVRVYAVPYKPDVPRRTLYRQPVLYKQPVYRVYVYAVQILNGYKRLSLYDKLVFDILGLYVQYVLMQ